MTPQWLVRNLTMPVLIRQRVPDGIDEYGNVAYAETTYSAMGFLRPVAATDLQQGRAGLGSYILILPAEVAPVVDGFVSFVIGGATYEADGPSQPFAALHNPATHHVEITVVRGSS